MSAMKARQQPDPFAGKVQGTRFEGGGFVLHKITDPKMTGRLSAWFDKDDKLIDCEAIYANGRPRTVKPGEFAWSIAEKAGRVYGPSLPKPLPL